MNTASNSTTEDLNGFRNTSFAVLTTLGVIGILGNGLVCVTILRARFMHSVTNFMIGHLAFADFFVCLTFLVFQERFVSSEDHLHDTLRCLFFKAKIAVWFAVSLSNVCMVCVTVERYIAILYPLHYPRYLSSFRVKVVTVGLWALSAASASSPAFFPIDVHETKSCLPDLTIPTTLLHVLYIIRLAQFSAPVLLMFFCYGKIIVNLYRKAQLHRHVNNQAPADDLNRAQRKVALLLLSLAAIYVAIWSSIAIFNSYLYLSKVKDAFLTQIFTEVYPILIVLNSLVNPIIYAFKYKEFQKGVREAVLPSCLQRQHRVDVGNNDIAMG